MRKPVRLACGTYCKLKTAAQKIDFRKPIKENLKVDENKKISRQHTYRDFD
jgi:hypothetical protein